MKKTELKKLSLNRESLRRLNEEAELSQVAGARTTVTDFSYCYTCPC